MRIIEQFITITITKYQWKLILRKASVGFILLHRPVSIQLTSALSVAIC